MAFDLKELGRLTVPGLGGHSLTGAAKNDKVAVWGDIHITSYTAGGEPVTAADFGLSTTDAVFLSVRDVDDSLPTATNIHVATYDYGAEQVLAWDGSAGTTVPGASAQLKFLAIGDSADAPELT